MKRIWLSVVVLSALAAIGCSQKNPAARMTDQELESAIEARIQTDSELREQKLKVDADAEKNEATLSGGVATTAQRERAVDLAHGARPGLMVRDRLEVKPADMARSEYTEDMAKQAREKAMAMGDKIGETVDDAWIHTKIVAGLIGNTETPGRKINVDVDHNAVTLRGTVENEQEKTEAERVAQAVEGVRSVRNMIKVRNT